MCLVSACREGPINQGKMAARGNSVDEEPNRPLEMAPRSRSPLSIQGAAEAVLPDASLLCFVHGISHLDIEDASFLQRFEM